MKKLFTLIAAILLTANVNAKTALEGTWSPWGATTTVEGNVVSFASAWTGAGLWLGNNPDFSAYDFIWIEMADLNTDLNFCVEHGVMNDEGISITDDSKKAITATGSAGDKIIGLDITTDPVKNLVAQVWIQAKAPGSVKVLGVYAGSKDEYEEAKNSNTTAPATKKDLSLLELSTGWGSSTYDAATKTVTIGDDWSGKGWWLASWDNEAQTNVGTDYSAFDKLVVELEPTTAQGQVNLEYGNDAPSASVPFNPGAEVIVIDLDAEGKKSVNQAYLQGPAGSQYVLKAAYFCTAEVAPEAQLGTPADYTGEVWNFTDWDAKDYTAETTKNGLTVVATEGKKVTVDGSNKSFGEATYTQRLKLGGAGSAEARYLKFNVQQGVTVTVHFAHASSSGDVRNLVLALGEFGNEVMRQPVDAGETATLTYKNEGEANTAYLYSANSGLNIYGIILTVDGGTGIQNTIQNDKTGNEFLHNLKGQRVDANYKGIVVKNGKKYLQR